MEWITLGSFFAALLFCIVFNISILYALALGLLLFLLYGRHKGISWKDLSRMAFDGIRTVRTILITFLLIGVLTALWRSSGTISVIVSYASKLIDPSGFLLLAFILNSIVSVLTGTAFGTAATMGVVCVTIASSLGIAPVLIGGAVMSGVYFGDRCSPVSTSALLVAELTETSIFDNIKKMVRSAIIPFMVTCLVYAVLGSSFGGSERSVDLDFLFGKSLSFHWTALIPALIILVLSVFRINVKITMIASIISAAAVSIFVQHQTLMQLLTTAVVGYRADGMELGSMLNGGGIVSMLKVGGIVCISSSYSMIFKNTGLLDGISRKIRIVSNKTTPFIAMLCTSCMIGIVACNQTLTIMLTKQLCDDLEQDPLIAANGLEDTAVVIAPLVPWSIASTVPLSVIGVPVHSLLLAFYLFLIPLNGAIHSLIKKQRRIESQEK